MNVGKSDSKSTVTSTSRERGRSTSKTRENKTAGSANEDRVTLGDTHSQLDQQRSAEMKSLRDWARSQARGIASTPSVGSHTHSGGPVEFGRSSESPANVSELRVEARAFEQANLERALNFLKP